MPQEKLEVHLLVLFMCYKNILRLTTPPSFMIYPCMFVHACDCTWVYMDVCGRGRTCGGQMTNSAVASHIPFTLCSMYVCVSVCNTYIRVREQVVGVSPSTPWISEMQLRSSGLGPDTYVHQAIFLALSPSA